MMKIVASFVILGLCANVALGVAPTVTTNSGGITSSLLNSTATQILKGTNSTDSANWDSSTAAVSGGAAATNAGVYASTTWFGPGATNDTSYLWGIPSSAVTTPSVTGTNPGAASPSITAISSIRKRTINNTVVGWGNDTSEASVVSDTSVSLSIMGQPVAAIGPGYLALLSASYDSTTATQVNQQVYITIVSGAAGSASTTKLTTTADVYTGSSTAGSTAGCTATTFNLGNVWYDIGSGAFFFTYWKQVVTQTAPSSGTTCTTVASTYANTIYLGGIYPNGTQYWTAPISVAASNTASSGISSLVGGGDNWLNATNIYIAFRDSSNTAVYSSKTTKATTTTAVGSPGKLVSDSTTGTSGTSGYVAMTYTPSSVWASNFTYGITVANTTNTYTTAAATSYTYTNYLNGSSSGVDSGLSSSGAYAIGSYKGWQLNTGYTVVASWSTGTSSPYPTSYTYATYYANGTANMTATSLGSLTYSSAQFYEDVNGTMWIGWTDVDYGNNAYTYNAYLAKFQGQLNVPSGAAILSAISAFFALFLAAIFVF